MNFARDFKQLLIESADSENEYVIHGLLVISNKTDLMKTDVLSQMRAIEGVTRVHVEEAVKRNYYELSRILLKVNATPFGLVPLFQIFEEIRKNIISIDGVSRFTYITRPTRI